jgi:hypothetical protein
MPFSFDLRSWRFLAAELIVVFLGVYGAFWVDNYRDQQNKIERTEAVVRVLIQDMNDLVNVGGRFNDFIEDGLMTWDEARQRGETPPPFVFRTFGAEVPPLTTWEVVRQTELAELIESDLLFELGFFYNELSGVGDRYVRYAEFTESDVLPQLKTGSSGFYNESGDRLLPRFEAHMDRLREYRLMSVYLIDWAECLTDRISALDKSGAECRSDLGVTPFEAY